MQTQDHLRPVPDESPHASAATVPNGTSEPPKERAPRRLPTSRALPTDRMKFELQTAALCALAVESEYGKTAVGSDLLARRLKLSPTTAGLNSPFFVEMGLATREGKGKYKPVAQVNDFARKYSFDQKAAGLLLGPILRESWAYKEIVKQTELEPRVTRSRMVEALADAADGTAAHRPQLMTLLEWLAYGGVVKLAGEVITVTAPAAGASGTGGGDQKSPEPQDQQAAAAGEGTTTKHPLSPVQGEPLLGFNFSFALTAEALKQLDSDQIKALFAAVGELVALKAKLGAD